MGEWSSRWRINFFLSSARVTTYQIEWSKKINGWAPLSRMIKHIHKIPMGEKLLCLEWLGSAETKIVSTLRLDLWWRVPTNPDRVNLVKILHDEIWPLIEIATINPFNNHCENRLVQTGYSAVRWWAFPRYGEVNGWQYGRIIIFFNESLVVSL